MSAGMTLLTVQIIVQAFDKPGPDKT
jgi:hypothetical protein